MELKGAVAVVTGGNGGLGQRICHALAKEGANIAVVYAQSANEAGAVADEVRKHGVEAAAVPVRRDAARADQRLVDDVVKRFGRLDILINDAAYNKSIPFKDLDGLTTEEWSKIIDVNLTGPMHCHQGGRAGDEEAGARPHREHRLDRRPASRRLVDRLRGVEGRAHSPDALHGGRARAGGAGQLRRARPARRHARHREPLEDADRQLRQRRRCSSAPPTRTTAPTRSSPCAAPKR